MRYLLYWYTKHKYILTQVVLPAVLGRGVLEVDKKEAFTSNEGVGCRMTQVRLLPL